jgi:diadenosine tetraphosphate (Ap4A) HIT family hydrolase
MHNCLICHTLHDNPPPLGGVVYESRYWAFYLRAQPLLVAGQGFVVLKRHCEDLADLTDDEAQDLGVMMRRVTHALNQTIVPARVHLAVYAEETRHLHLHVTPRMPYHPKGNIRLTALLQWYALLHRIGLHNAVSDLCVHTLVQQLRQIMDVPHEEQ